MNNPKHLKTYLTAYKDAVNDCLEIVEHWQNISKKEKYTDVDWVVSMMEADIYDIQEQIKDLTKRVES